MGLKSKLNAVMDKAITAKMTEYVDKVILPICFDIQKTMKVDDYEMYCNVVLQKLRESREGVNNA